MTIKGSPTAQFRIDAAQALRQSLFLAELSEMTLDEFSYLMGDLLRDETNAIKSSVRILAHPEMVTQKPHRLDHRSDQRLNALKRHNHGDHAVDLLSRLLFVGWTLALASVVTTRLSAIPFNTGLPP
jgi:hypothetical protein